MRTVLLSKADEVYLEKCAQENQFSYGIIVGHVSRGRDIRHVDLFGSFPVPPINKQPIITIRSVSKLAASGPQQERGGALGPEQRGGCRSGGSDRCTPLHRRYQLTGVGLTVAKRKQNVSRLLWRHRWVCVWIGLRVGSSRVSYYMYIGLE